MRYGKFLSKETAICVLAVLAVSYLVFFYNLGAYSLKEPDEGRYAEIPREMIEQGDYVVPHLDYVRYFEKPPLLYWACAGSYKLFGVNEWSFRFPNALAALACVLVTGLFAGRWFSARAGLISGLHTHDLLSASSRWPASSRIDMLFSFLLFASLSCSIILPEKEDVFFSTFPGRPLPSRCWRKAPLRRVLLEVAAVLFLWSEKNMRFLKRSGVTKGVSALRGNRVSLVRPHSREGEGVLPVFFHRPARPQVSDDKAQQVRPSLLFLPCLVRRPLSLVDIYSQGRHPLLARKGDAAAPYLVPCRFHVLQRVGLEAAPLYPPPFPLSRSFSAASSTGSGSPGCA